MERMSGVQAELVYKLVCKWDEAHQELMNYLKNGELALAETLILRWEEEMKMVRHLLKFRD